MLAKVAAIGSSSPVKVLSITTHRMGEEEKQQSRSRHLAMPLMLRWGELPSMALGTSSPLVLRGCQIDVNTHLVRRVVEGE